MGTLSVPRLCRFTSYLAILRQVFSNWERCVVICTVMNAINCFLYCPGQAAVTYTKDHNISEARQIEWILVNNITLNPPDQPNCWQPRMINHTTRMFGADVGVNTTAEGSNAHPLLPSAPPMDPGDSIAGAADDSLTEMLAFGFNNMQQALQLPPMVPDKYFQIENVRLYQLPQGPGLSGVQSTQGSDTAVAPDVWTVLLWSIMRWG